MIQVKMIHAQRRKLQGDINACLRKFPNCLIEAGYPADAKYAIKDVRIAHSASGGNDLAYILYEISDDTPYTDPKEVSEDGTS